nr:MAG TPA: hypothetical protein [Caudoviricetes sp.]
MPLLYALAVNEFSSLRLTPWVFAFLESKKKHSECRLEGFLKAPIMINI